MPNVSEEIYLNLIINQSAFNFVVKHVDADFFNDCEPVEIDAFLLKISTAKRNLNWEFPIKPNAKIINNDDALLDFFLHSIELVNDAHTFNNITLWLTSDCQMKFIETLLKSRNRLALECLMSEPWGHRLLMRNPHLVALIKEEDFNAISEEKEPTYSSPLHALTSSGTGLSVLKKYPQLLAMIHATTLNAIISDGANKGSSPVFCLTKDEEGLTLLDENPELVAKINRESLNTIIFEMNCQ